MSDFTGMRQIVADDGVVTFVDSGTKVTKKNRKRHMKDGTPKKERGKAGTAVFATAEEVTNG
jgi:hypothetical protein